MITNEAFRFIADNSPNVVWALDKDFNFLYINQATTRLTGYTVEERMALPLNQRFTKKTFERLLDLYGKFVEDKGHTAEYVVEVELIHKGGFTIIGVVRFKVFEDEEKNIVLIGTTIDLHDFRRANQIPFITDPMTGINNKMFFYHRLDSEFDRAKRSRHFLAVMMIDIDFLEGINEAYGLKAGDKALLTVTDILIKNTRSYDVIARFEEDEFCILMPRVKPENAFAIAERIRVEIATTPIKFNDETFHISASIGLTHCKEDDVMGHIVVNRAGEAVEKAKIIRNCTHVK